MSTWSGFSADRASPLVIAEIGAKYAPIGTMEQMVRAAAAAGADMVKFQTYRAETIATPGCEFVFEDGTRISQFDYFKQHELTLEDHTRLDHVCRELGIAWISTPSHPEDVDLLERFDPPAYKTGSDDLTNLPFLRAIAAKKRPMIVSTGMSTMGEIEQAVDAIVGAGNRSLTLLHCVVSYPSRAEDANLRVIETLRRAFGFPVGLSDHTQDELTSVLAVALGATIIEKHLTLDHALGLPDHEASLDPGAFETLVRRVKLTPRALGSGVKHVEPTERKWRASSRKSLVAVRDLASGSVLRDGDLEGRRPGKGVSPLFERDFIGRRLTKPLASGEQIDWAYVE